MLAEGRFEKGVKRIGAEQEMFLTDASYLPAPGALKMLEKLKDPHFTTELGAFQLEMNADPHVFGGSGFSALEKQMSDLVKKAWDAADALGLHAVLIGILPTMRQADLGLENMVPSPRYLALSKAVHALRGSDFEFSIQGLDELVISHDSVMVEACNSSFQVHLQVDADDFAHQYNLAQVLSGPLMSVSCNSPLLFGKRLWAETRIALFQQSVDTRTKTQHLREAAARVTFGTRFVEKSITEIFREDIARFRALVGTDLDEDPMQVLDKGGAPQLKALRLHNGTIYRWNRACYGIIDGVPHLRIENRVMPSGPSVADEVANAAFWCGMMVDFAKRYEDITKHIDFDHAAGNFYTAAREGYVAPMYWLDGQEVSAQKLVLDTLLPSAEAGLRSQKVAEADIKRYLGIIDARVRSGRTGARWLTGSLHRMKDEGSAGQRASALVAATLTRQRSGKPVSEWEQAHLSEAGATKHTYQRVEQFMTTDLFTVEVDDAVDLVAHIMSSERVRYVPVEDKEHRLVGLISNRAVLRFLSAGGHTKDVSVSELMKKDVMSVTPHTLTLEAIHLMRKNRIGCLPVLQDGKLVGVLTEENFLKIAGDLLEAQLRE
ncbi:MAG: CBS domain-containing protein [Archangium sp.]|nr:CBS domain-containing protein [Archangium sp.]